MKRLACLLLMIALITMLVVGCGRNQAAESGGQESNITLVDPVTDQVTDKNPVAPGQEIEDSTAENAFNLDPADGTTVADETVKLLVTKDFGAQIIITKQVAINKDWNIIDLLNSSAKIETKWNGSFINSIEGLESNKGGILSERRDWFYYINGICANVGAADYTLKSETEGGAGFSPAMQPDIILLDEPTSQLDPIAGEEILNMIRRLNEENGITVVLIEQRLERCFHLADRILVMDQGRIAGDHHTPEAAAHWAVQNSSPFMPPLVKLFSSIEHPEIPVTVKQGRRIIKSSADFQDNTQWQVGLPEKTAEIKKIRQDCLVDVQELWFTYPDGKEVLKNTISTGLCFQ